MVPLGESDVQDVKEYVNKQKRDASSSEGEALWGSIAEELGMGALQGASGSGSMSAQLQMGGMDLMGGRREAREERLGLR